MLQIAVIFALVFFLLRFHAERAVARAAADELRLRDGGGRDLFAAGLARLIQADDVKEVQNVPALVQPLHLEYRAVGIIRALERVERQLARLGLAVVVGGDAVPGRKIVPQLLRELVKGNAALFKVGIRLMQRPVVGQLGDAAQLRAGQRRDGLLERGLECRAVRDLRGLEQHHGLDLQPVVLKYLQPVLAEDDGLQRTLHDRHVGAERFDLLGKAIGPEFGERIVIDDLVPILREDLRVIEVARGGELQQDVVAPGLKNAPHRLLPAVIQPVLLRPGLELFRVHVQVVRLVGDEDDLLSRKVVERDGVLLREPEVGMQRLRGGEADVDGVFVRSLEIAHLADGHGLAADAQLLREQVLAGRGIQKIVLRLFDDVRQVHKKQEVAVSHLIEIQHQPRHDERFAGAGRHVKQRLRRAFAHLFVLEIGDKILKRGHLIGPQLELRVQVLLDAGRELRAAAVFAQHVELLIEELHRSALPVEALCKALIFLADGIACVIQIA